MALATRCRAQARKHIDNALSRAFRAPLGDPRAATTFAWLVEDVQRSSNLLTPESAGASRSRSHAVDALVRLAKHHRYFLRSSAGWAGGRGEPRQLVNALATHLMGDYPVPKVMHGAWFGTPSAHAALERQWYMHHARGVRFRDLEQLPFSMTRKMERLFIQSPPHLGIVPALRRAELLALGADDDLIAAVMDTRLASTIEHGEFWRSVLHFFIQHWSDLDPGHVGPIVEFVHEAKFRARRFVDRDGVAMLTPPDPAFSMKGRTPRSLARYMARGVGHGATARRLPWGNVWDPCGISPATWMGDERPRATPTSFQMIELRCPGQLLAEGHAMRHCVFGYVQRCIGGVSSIWSLRRVGDGSPRGMATIELLPHTRRIVQVRARSNRQPSALACSLIHDWARREGLHIVEGAFPDDDLR